MLNELHNEIEQTDSRIDSTMKKVAKVLHLSNGKLFISLASFLEIKLRGILRTTFSRSQPMDRHRSLVRPFNTHINFIYRALRNTPWTLDA